MEIQISEGQKMEIRNWKILSENKMLEKENWKRKIRKGKLGNLERRIGKGKLKKENGKGKLKMKFGKGKLENS